MQLRSRAASSVRVTSLGLRSSNRRHLISLAKLRAMTGVFDVLMKNNTRLAGHRPGGLTDPERSLSASRLRCLPTFGRGDPAIGFGHYPPPHGVSSAEYRRG